MINEDSDLSLVLLDILRGYSVFYKNDKKLYFKHFLVSETLALDEFELDAYKQAKKDGIKSEEELIESAIKKKYWSKDIEEKIKTLNWTIHKSETAASKITDNIQKISFNASIQKQRDELSQIQEKRNNIIQYSAESCASHKRNLRLIETSIFTDEKLTCPAEATDSNFIMNQLNKRLNFISREDVLIRVAYLNSFFELYTLSHRDPLSMIKRDIFNITVLQKNLLMYASLILYKLKNVDMPDDIKKDPIKIIKYQKSEGREVKRSEGVDDLREKMLRNNGKLNAEDLLS
jgi:hypothetical protein